MAVTGLTVCVIPQRESGRCELSYRRQVLPLSLSAKAERISALRIAEERGVPLLNLGGTTRAFVPFMAAGPFLLMRNA